MNYKFRKNNGKIDCTYKSKKQKPACKAYRRNMFPRTTAVFLAVILVLANLLPFGISAEAEGENTVTVNTFKELSDAVDNLPDGGSVIIKLGADIDISDPVSVIGKKKVTILGNGRTLTYKKFNITEKGIFKVNEGSVLNLGLPEYKEESSLVLDGMKKYTDFTPFEVSGSGSTLNMYSGVIIKNADESRGGEVGGVHLEEDATFNMYGGEITECKGNQGTVLLNRSTFNMYAGSIDNCAGGNGSYTGGVVAMANSKFNMYNGEIDKCDGMYSGGVLIVSSSFSMGAGAAIEHCIAYYAGGLWIGGGQSTEFKSESGAVIANNHAHLGGADIVIADESTQITLPDPSAMNRVYEDDTKEQKRKINGWFWDYGPRYKVDSPTEKITDSSVTGEMLLIAAVDPSAGYTLKYDPNAGTDTVTSMPDPSEVTKEGTENNTADFTVSDSVPLRAGYHFLGWADDPKAASPDEKYSAGKTVTLRGTSDEDREKTLYAVWISDADLWKGDTPALVQKVWKGSKWQDTAFGGANKKEKEILFKLTGTLPKRLDAKKTVNGETEGTLKETDFFSRYDTYTLKDTLPAGITIDDVSKDVKVYLYDSGEGLTSENVPSGNDSIHDITSLFDIRDNKNGSDGSHTLKAKLKESGVKASGETESGAVDLKKKYDIDGKTISFSKDSKIVMRFTAALNKDAVKGSEGNEAEAWLKYTLPAESENVSGTSGEAGTAGGAENTGEASEGTGKTSGNTGESSENNETTESTGKTPEDPVKIFTFGLQITKYDGSAEKGKELEGAGFKLYAGSVDDKNLLAEGKSGADGIVDFKDLKSIAGGRYILVETETPAGYETNKDSEFTLTPEAAETGDTSAELNLTDVNITSSKSKGNDIFTLDRDRENVIGKIVNKPGAQLPATGGPGTGRIYLSGGLLLAAAIFVLISCNKKAFKGN